MASTKIRVYELARELGKDTKVMEQIIRRSSASTIKNYMSTLSDERGRARCASHVGWR